jgi:sulfite exporter TauE/SafE
VEAGLILGGLLLGIGGSPHCAAMCAAPCAALTRSPREAGGFHGGRLIGYMAAGAVVAASVSSLGLAREAWPVLRPLWAMLQAAALALGLWLLVTGRQPDWRFGRAPAVLAGASAGGGWTVMRGPGRSAAVGLCWTAWPCGLLYSALALAALANGPAGGAAVMAAFALASLPALWAGPALLRRLVRAGHRSLAVRIAGGLIVAAAAWALGHGMWERALAWCLG